MMPYTLPKLYLLYSVNHYSSHFMPVYTMVTTSNSLYTMDFILSPLNYNFFFVPYFY